MKKIQKIFEEQGGQFITPASQIQKKLKNIKAYIFDWDGVFNTGTKGESKSSNYSEVDAMGTNMLRLGYWLSNNKELPVVSIITGENNSMAIYLAEREHFNHIYFNFKNKAVAFEHLLNTYQLKPEEVAFCFDDILDFPITKQCGLKFMVGRKGSPLFNQYAIEKGYVDYISGQQGGNFAIREITELILGLLNQYNNALDERSAFGKNYSAYLKQRNSQSVKKFVFKEEKIHQID
jgi:3-deoxy-D-manno-octulosonate 8-phosphate phosphatase (KDO 8-P phosphatase)